MPTQTAAPAAVPTSALEFDVRDLWAKKTLMTAQKGGFRATVPSHDIAIFRLSKPAR